LSTDADLAKKIIRELSDKEDLLERVEDSISERAELVQALEVAQIQIEALAVKSELVDGLNSKVEQFKVQIKQLESTQHELTVPSPAERLSDGVFGANGAASPADYHELKDECVHLVVNKKGKVKDDGDLQKEGTKVYVGKIGSGSYITWKYFTKLEPGFKKAAALPKAGSRALAKIADGKVDAYFIVLTPNLSNKLNRTVCNNDKLEFADVTDWDLNDKLDGKQIYTFKNVKVC